jgi:RNA polymerase sigma factor (sigma-70 family)
MVDGAEPAVDWADPIAGADLRSDAELIAAVRGGDSSAFGALWTRHHPAVLRYARQFGPLGAAEDLASEAFARLLRILQVGGGPDMNVRPYLLTSVRRLRIDIATRYERRVGLTDDDSELDRGLASDGADQTALEALEARTVWRAYSSLPERWQTVLWHTLIEEQPPAAIAPILGSSPNAVAALAMRAREGLRQAFLQAHVADTDSADCHRALRRLGAWQRGALSAREAAQVEQHLLTCDRCRGAAAEVGELNQAMRVVVLPVLLGGTWYAHRYLESRPPVPSAGAPADLGNHTPRGPRHRRRSGAIVGSGAALLLVIGVVAVNLRRQDHVDAADGVLATSAPAASSAPASSATPSPTPVSTRRTVSSSRPIRTPSPTPTPPVGATATPRTTAATTAPAPPATPSVRRTTGARTTAGLGVPPLSTPPPPPVLTSRVVTVIVTPVHNETTGQLTLTAPANWLISTVSAPAGDSCSVAGSTSTCTVVIGPDASRHTFQVSLTTPAPRSADGLVAHYQDPYAANSRTYGLR